MATSTPAPTTATLLATKRTELEAELNRISAPVGDQSGISFGKRIGEGTSIAVDRLASVSTYETLQRVHADVSRSQIKLTAGTYGQCDRCGKQIAEGRLEALPWAVLCINCAAKLGTRR